MTPIDLEALRGHTPGPWTNDSGYLTGTDYDQPYAEIVANDGETVIASFNNQIPEGQANADLMTAAPILLTELTTRRARDADVEALVEAAVELRFLHRTVLDVNCKCDDEFIGFQLCRIDTALTPFTGAKP